MNENFAVQFMTLKSSVAPPRSRALALARYVLDYVEGGHTFLHEKSNPLQYYCIV